MDDFIVYLREYYFPPTATVTERPAGYLLLAADNGQQLALYFIERLPVQYRSIDGNQLIALKKEKEKPKGVTFRPCYSSEEFTQCYGAPGKKSKNRQGDHHHIYREVSIKRSTYGF